MNLLKSHLNNLFCICVGGMECTGSTFVWQLVNHLYPFKVQKIHHYDVSYNLVIVTYRDPRDVICSYAKRQLKGIDNPTLLDERLFDAIKILFLQNKRHIDVYRYLESRNTILIKYEEFIAHRQYELLKLIEICCKRNLDHNQRVKVLEEFSLSKNKERSAERKSFNVYDPKDQIHGNHISSNGAVGVWKNILKDEHLSIIYKELGSFFDDFNYEI